MKRLLLTTAAAVSVASLPRWLPRAVVGARVWVFSAVNGREGIPVPGETVDVSRFRELYAHPAAVGRARGSKLADLIWYWVSPGAHVHQEQVESGPGHDEIARCTRRVLARSTEDVEQLARRCAVRALDRLEAAPNKPVRLRDVVMPISAELVHELVFGTPCRPPALRLATQYSDDVLNGLKCVTLRHMDRRAALTRYLLDRVRAGEVAHRLPEGLSDTDQALYLQGNFFGTGVGQMAEAVSHMLLALAQNPDIQARLAAGPADSELTDRVIHETLRMYPLFGIAQRVTTDDISVDGTALPAGSVLCFNYLAYHQSGFEDPDRFDPDRWLTLSPKDATYIPFGVTANRPCPARGIAPVIMRVLATEVLRRYALYSSASHTRSLPNRGPCLLLPRDPEVTPPRGALALMRLRDDWENLWRSLKQLVLGTVLVTHARSEKLCRRHHRTTE